MKELLDAIGARVKSPVLGYYSAAFIIFNWKPLLYLFMQTGSVTGRFTYFDTHTDIFSTLLWPAALAAAIAATYPWINYGFLKLTSAPTRLKNTLQARSEHHYLIQKQELEKARSELMKVAENELIEQAKRDEEIEKIENDETRIKLQEEIDKLRKETEERLNYQPKTDSKNKYRELMEVAAEFRNRADHASDVKDRAELKQKAGELEDKAHNMVLKDVGNGGFGLVPPPKYIQKQ